MLLHNIKEKCKERGINIAQLERSAGLTSSTIYKWDKTVPAADKLSSVADVLGTTVKALLYGENEGGSKSA